MEHDPHVRSPRRALAGLPRANSTCRLPGPPLTEKTAAQVLLEYGVTVGLGIEESWSARNTRFDIAWASLVFCPVMDPCTDMREIRLPSRPVATLRKAQPLHWRPVTSRSYLASTCRETSSRTTVATYGLRLPSPLR